MGYGRQEMGGGRGERQEVKRWEAGGGRRGHVTGDGKWETREESFLKNSRHRGISVFCLLVDDA